MPDAWWRPRIWRPCRAPECTVGHSGEESGSSRKTKRVGVALRGQRDKGMVRSDQGTRQYIFGR